MVCAGGELAVGGTVWPARVARRGVGYCPSVGVLGGRRAGAEAGAGEGESVRTGPVRMGGIAGVDAGVGSQRK